MLLQIICLQVLNMFKPKFEYTNKLVKLVSKISAADAIINTTNLLHSYDLLFKDSAIVKSAHYSTSIAGNSLDLKKTYQLYNGEEVKETERSLQEVLNYFEVIENLDNYSENRLDTSIIALINRDLTTKTLENPELAGTYRNLNVSSSLTEILEWLNQEDELHPVLTAGIIYHQMATKLPFCRGNGKTARILIHLIFNMKEFNYKKYYQVDEYFHDNQKSCYRALIMGTEVGNITDWLEYFSNAILITVTKIRDDVINIYEEKCINHKPNQIPISPREIRIFQFLRTKKKIQSSDIQNMFGISHNGVFKYIQKLIDSNVIVAKGTGRNTYYVLKK